MLYVTLTQPPVMFCLPAIPTLLKCITLLMFDPEVLLYNTLHGDQSCVPEVATLYRHSQYRFFCFFKFVGIFIRNNGNFYDRLQFLSQYIGFSWRLRLLHQEINLLRLKLLFFACVLHFYYEVNITIFIKYLDLQPVYQHKST